MIFFQLLGWILTQKIVELIFGPNLHVEVIKQCHVLLNFLAVEGKITNEHINVIWQAAQLKHCSKQVHDLLLPLIKNLEAGPVLHLYDLMKELPVKGMNTWLHLFNNRWRGCSGGFNIRHRILELGYQKSFFSQNCFHSLDWKIFLVFFYSILHTYDWASIWYLPMYANFGHFF